MYFRDRPSNRIPFKARALSLSIVHPTLEIKLQSKVKNLVTEK